MDTYKTKIRRLPRNYDSRMSEEDQALWSEMEVDETFGEYVLSQIEFGFWRDGWLRGPSCLLGRSRPRRLGGGAQVVAPQAPVAPAPPGLDMLTEMGFDENLARIALQAPRSSENLVFGSSFFGSSILELAAGASKKSSSSSSVLRLRSSVFRLPSSSVLRLAETGCQRLLGPEIQGTLSIGLRLFCRL